MFGLRWARADKTFLFLLLLLVPVVPMTAWLIVEMSSGLNTRGSSLTLITWVGASGGRTDPSCSPHPGDQEAPSDLAGLVFQQTE